MYIDFADPVVASVQTDGAVYLEIENAALLVMAEGKETVVVTKEEDQSLSWIIIYQYYFFRSRDQFHRGGPRNRSNERRRSHDRPRIIDHRDRRPPRANRTPPRGRLPGPERRDVMPFVARKSPPKDARLDMSAQERDYRTIFAMQVTYSRCHNICLFFFS